MKTKQVNFCNEVLTVLEETDLKNFRILNESEKEEFRKAGRNLVTVRSTFHPISQNEMLKKLKL